MVAPTHETSLSLAVGSLWQRLQHTMRYLRQVLQHAGKSFADDRGSQIAAALTYHTVFSLLPTMALALVVLKAFVGPAEQAAFKDFIVDFIARWLSDGPRDLGQAADLLLPDAAAAAERALRYGEVLAQLDQNVKQLLDDLQTIDFQRIGVVGVLVFVYAATALLATVERSFNQIFDAPSSRPWYFRVPLYYTTITLAPVLILAGQLMQDRLLAGIETISWTNWLTRPVAASLPLITTWLVFTLMYALIPNARVNLRAAAVSGALAAIVWVAALEGFAIYVGNFAGASLYGALALFPLALLWVWISWVIVLVGLVMTRTVQYRPWRTTASPGELGTEHGQPASYDPRWLLLLLVAVVERFEGGMIAAVGELADDLGLADKRVSQMLELLESEGLVHRVEESDGRACGFVLARPAQAIDVNQLLDLAESRTLGEWASEAPGAATLERLREGRRKLMTGVSVAEAREAR